MTSSSSVGPRATILRPVLSADTSARVLTVHWAEATLTNLKITGGSEREGGGIYVFHGRLTLTHSLVTGNSATYVGGGIDERSRQASP